MLNTPWSLWFTFLSSYNLITLLLIQQSYNVPIITYTFDSKVMLDLSLHSAYMHQYIKLYP